MRGRRRRGTSVFQLGVQKAYSEKNASQTISMTDGREAKSKYQKKKKWVEENRFKKH